MKVKELRAMPKEELKSKLKELKKELMKHNAQIAIGASPQNPGKVKVIKKSIARIMTLMSEGDRAKQKAATEKKVV